MPGLGGFVRSTDADERRLIRCVFCWGCFHGLEGCFCGSDPTHSQIPFYCDYRQDIIVSRNNINHQPGTNLMNDEKVIESNSEVMSGAIVFCGTRVPFQTMMDYLESGENLNTFLEDFPTVSREQAIMALEQAKYALTNEIAA